jgi:hypothetical protein
VVEAFLIGVKQEGPETTNCRRRDLHDYHLWMVDTQGQTKAQAVVVEITPRWRAANAGWRVQTLRRLAQQRAKVRITGWLMFDTDHPDQIGKTRGGLWEIHPITTIEVFSGADGLSCDPTFYNFTRAKTRATIAGGMKKRVKYLRVSM